MIICYCKKEFKIIDKNIKIKFQILICNLDLINFLITIIFKNIYLFHLNVKINKIKFLNQLKI